VKFASRGPSTSQDFLYTADFGCQAAALQAWILDVLQERIAHQSSPFITFGLTEGSLGQSLHRVSVVLQGHPSVSSYGLQSVWGFLGRQTKVGPDSLHDVGFIGPKSKTPGPACQAGRNWRMCAGSGHSAMVATSSNSQMNCSKPLSPPKIGAWGDTCHQVAPD